tara:strand:- start:79 stop:501 length:423 start_codon:yes stop_codon:yes gene_type:complete
LIRKLNKLKKIKKKDVPKKLSYLAIISVLFFSSSMNAHHSSAMFDKNNVLVVEATVREFQWANPHVWIQIIIKDEANNEEEWSIEGIGINTLFRRGWRPNSFAPGDNIQIKFNPMLDGSPAGLFVGARFENGKILGKWDE